MEGFPPSFKIRDSKGQITRERGRRGRRREHPNQHYVANFRWYCPTSGWACARPSTPSGDLRSQVRNRKFSNTPSGTFSPEVTSVIVCACTTGTFCITTRVVVQVHGYLWPKVTRRGGRACACPTGSWAISSEVGYIMLVGVFSTTSASTPYYSSSNAKCTGCACAHDHWRHFRWKGPTRGIAKLPVAHAHNILLVPDRASSGHAPSGHVTSGDITSDCSLLFPHKYDFVRTHILLMYLHLNNWEFCRVKSENMTLFMLSLIF
jgi:hypothetical protein